jgi:signal transduction histidine kinase
LNPFIRKILIIAGFLLPLLAGTLLYYFWLERDPTIVFKEPEKYPLEFKIDQRHVGHNNFFLPIPHTDSLNTPIQIQIVNAAPERSWAYFQDVKTQQPLPPNLNFTHPQTKLSHPLMGATINGYPEVVVMLSQGSEPGLLYFRDFSNPLEHGGHDNWGYSPVAVLEEDVSELQISFQDTRYFEMEFSDSGYFGFDIDVLAFHDIVAQQSGSELLVGILAENRDFSKHRSQLRLYNLATWQELWCLELPGVLSCIPMFEGGQQTGWLLSTGSASKGVEANGLKDSNCHLVKVDMEGNILTPPERLFTRQQEITVEWIFPYPGDDSRILTVSRYLHQTPNNGIIEVRRMADFQVEYVKEVGCISQCQVIPLSEEETGFRLLALDTERNIELYDEHLHLRQSLKLGEEFSFIHSFDRLSSASVQIQGPLFLLHTISGRLILLDSQFKVLAAEEVSSSPANQQTVVNSCVFQRHFYHDSLGSCSIGDIDYWYVNTSRGAFRGFWVKRPRLGFYLGWVCGFALFSWVLFYILILTGRWRFYSTMVNTLFRSSPDAILILDNQRRIRASNRRFRSLLPEEIELTPAKRRFQSWLPMRHKEGTISELLSSTQLEPLFQRVITRKEYFGTIDLIENNQPVTFYFRHDEMRRKKYQYGSALILQDITRHLAETRATIWKFMAQNTAHRLKSPLQRVKLAAESILVKVLSDQISKEQIAEKQRSILETTNDINHVIQEFLAISDRKINLQSLTVRDFLLKNIQHYREKNLTDEVTLNLKLADELPVIMADEYYLLTILVNLLDNSLKAVRGKGRIDVIAEVVMEANDTTHSSLQITVRDDGVGIAPEVLPRIFHHHESFFKDGHGIGLAVVHSLIRAHNGQISVESDLGSGTDFHLNFPLME